MDAVLTAMVEDHIGPGERSRLLVQTAKEQIRFDYALSLRSPAIALYLALKALNLEAGDGVLLSALSPRYYANVLADLQLKPLFCDVSFSLPCINRESIEKALLEKPPGIEASCILLHHTLGFIPETANMSGLGIPVIEDISQSYSAAENETEAMPGNESAAKDAHQPGRGNFIILGLEERDVLTSGGGALLYAMNRKDSSALRNFSGIPNEYCLPDINASLAVVQFKEAPRNAFRRSEIAQAYTQAFAQARQKGKHTLFAGIGSASYNNYAFPLVLETGMKDVISYARKKDIIVENAFEQSIIGSGIMDAALCPTSYSLSLRTALFPLYPRLGSQEAQRVSKLIMTLP